MCEHAGQTPCRHAWTIGLAKGNIPEHLHAQTCHLEDIGAAIWKAEAAPTATSTHPARKAARVMTEGLLSARV